MNQREIDAVVREADNNGDGTVDFEGEKFDHFKWTISNTPKSYTLYIYCTNGTADSVYGWSWDHVFLLFAEFVRMLSNCWEDLVYQADI